MTRGELLDRMDSSELTEWLAFSLYEPFGERRADLRAAQSDLLFANANRDPEKTPPFKFQDFMAHLDDDERERIEAGELAKEPGGTEGMTAFMDAMGAPPDNGDAE